MSDITLTVKEAEALEAELAALKTANEQLKAGLATAKTAAEKTSADKVAADLAEVMTSKKLISSDKLAETKANLLKEGGIASYFKKACDLYLAAEAGRKEAEARLKEIPTRVGRTVKDDAEKTATEKPQSALKAAEDRFAQRVLAGR